MRVPQQQQQQQQRQARTIIGSRRNSPFTFAVAGRWQRCLPVLACLPVSSASPVWPARFNRFNHLALIKAASKSMLHFFQCSLWPRFVVVVAVVAYTLHSACTHTHTHIHCHTAAHKHFQPVNAIEFVAVLM